MKIISYVQRDQTFAAEDEAKASIMRPRSKPLFWAEVSNP